MSQAVVEFINELHSLWPVGEVERLSAFYHPDVVLLPPDLGEPILGRDAVVASYREFLSACTLHRFDINDLAVFPFDDSPKLPVHMAHMRFEIDYTLDGQRFVEEGLEIYTVAGDEDNLCIVWRAQNVLDSRPLSTDS